MGNSQSNTRQPNYKIYKIISVEKEREWIRVYLHDYVTYKNGNYKHIDLEKYWFDSITTSYKEGNYLAIDLSATSCETSGHDFDYITVKRLGKDQVIEERDSNGGFIKFVCDTGEFLGELTNNRERYQASIVDARASNYANFRQTSYDMPPKW